MRAFGFIYCRPHGDGSTHSPAAAGCRDPPGAERAPPGPCVGRPSAATPPRTTPCTLSGVHLICAKSRVLPPGVPQCCCVRPGPAGPRRRPPGGALQPRAGSRGSVEVTLLSPRGGAHARIGARGGLGATEARPGSRGRTCGRGYADGIAGGGAAGVPRAQVPAALIRASGAGTLRPSPRRETQRGGVPGRCGWRRRERSQAGAGGLLLSWRASEEGAAPGGGPRAEEGGAPRSEDPAVSGDARPRPAPGTPAAGPLRSESPEAAGRWGS